MASPHSASIVSRILPASDHCLAESPGEDGTGQHTEIVAVAMVMVGGDRWESPVCRNHLDDYKGQTKFTVVLKA